MIYDLLCIADEAHGGWITASSFDHFCDAEANYNNIVSSGKKCRVVDNITKEILLCTEAGCLFDVDR